MTDETGNLGITHKETVTRDGHRHHVFLNCGEGCETTDYEHRDGGLYCRQCERYCDNEYIHRVPPAPYGVDEDGWYFRPLRADEDAEATDREIPGHLGFVSGNRKFLYLRGIEYDPHPLVKFESLGFPRLSDNPEL